jgi:hypothetical protein
MADRLDLDETARGLASQWTTRWASTRRGLVILVAAGAISGGGSAAWSEGYGWDWVGSVILGVAAAVFGVVVVLAVVDANNLIKAPRFQRDQARQRLLAIRDATTAYAIEYEDAFGMAGLPPTIQDESATFADKHETIGVLIRNAGVGAQFAVVLEEVEGKDGFGFPHVYDYLRWGGRPNITVEEIPPDEGRSVEVLATRPNRANAAGFEWALLGPSGIATNWWTCTDPELRLWIRVSARAVPEINYSRVIGLRVSALGTFAAQLPDRSDAVRLSRAPSLRSLLDFG